MTTKRPEAIAAIAGTMRSSVSRRRLLQAAGITGAAAVAAACGAGDSAPAASESAAGEGSAEAAPESSAAADMSDAEKVVMWSNWPLYIDYDDEETGRPTLDRFQQETGIEVTYNEDINDNNEFFAKVRTQLEQGQNIDRDLVVLTDWMAALWIQNGYAQKLDKAQIPNSVNLNPKYMGVSFDPNRDYSMPWQSGFGGLGFNVDGIDKALGTQEIVSLDQLFDPALKGRVTVLSEMRDTMGCLLAWQGADPSNFTTAEFENAIAALTEQVDSGQIRQVTGNDYVAALESGDVIACIGWSGDVYALDGNFGFTIPESGGMLWTDNMLVPSSSTHKKNAEAVINYYYDPVVAAEVAAWVWYICPVDGAQEAMMDIDPELAESPWIFPSKEILDQTYVFMELTPDQDVEYQRMFQRAIGN